MDWEDLTRKRIRKVLRNNRVGNIRQLESKISEAGPPRMRVMPDLITKALKELVNEKIIFKKVIDSDLKEELTFYLAEDFNPNSKEDSEKFNKTTTLYQKYLKIVNDQKYCGDVLEEIVLKTLEAAGYYSFIGGPSEKTDHRLVNGKKIDGNFDFILFSKNNLEIIGVEVKNKRKWIYPDSKDVWVMIDRCINNKSLPIIVARKFPYFARNIFKVIGILGYETHNQFFHPSLEDDMKEIKAKDGLGFADIRFTNNPEDRHVKFFKETVPKQEEYYRNIFYSNCDILSKYSHKLKEDIPSSTRNSIFFNFLREIGLVINYTDYPDDYYHDYY